MNEENGDNEEEERVKIQAVVECLQKERDLNRDKLHNIFTSAGFSEITEQVCCKNFSHLIINNLCSPAHQSNV